MKHLMECCEIILQSFNEIEIKKKRQIGYLNQISMKNVVIKHLVLADMYDLPNLRKHCIEQSGKIKLYELEQDPDYGNVQPATLIEVLKSMLRKQAK